MLHLPFVKHHRWYGIYVLVVSVKHRIPDPTSLHALAALARPVQWGMLSQETTSLENNLSPTGFFKPW